jgi:signal transduction histidine kinase
MLDSIEKNRRAIENAHMRMARQHILAEMGKFSLMVAHEVKNPLGIMKSTLDVLKKRIPTENKTDYLMAYIEEEISQLNKLIEDFLTFAQPAVPRFQATDANKMILELAERIESLYTRINFDITIPEGPCDIYADPSLCSRAIFNILINAVSANNETGTITVIVECAGEYWRVMIADQGKGIAEKDMEKIFEPFYSTRAKGSGLGLTFAYQVVKAHGGAVHADNYIKGGAVFTVEMPRKQMNQGFFGIGTGPED